MKTSVQSAVRQASGVSRRTVSQKCLCRVSGIPTATITRRRSPSSRSVTTASTLPNADDALRRSRQVGLLPRSRRPMTTTVIDWAGDTGRPSERLAFFVASSTPPHNATSISSKLPVSSVLKITGNNHRR